MEERGLKLASPIDDERTDNTSHSAIIGKYRTESHLHDADLFDSFPGPRTRTLSNGDWVEAILTTEDDGIVTVHTLNPNVRTRKTFDYRESSAMMK